MLRRKVTIPFVQKAVLLLLFVLASLHYIFYSIMQCHFRRKGWLGLRLLQTDWYAHKCMWIGITYASYWNIAFGFRWGIIIMPYKEKAHEIIRISSLVFFNWNFNNEFCKNYFQVTTPDVSLRFGSLACRMDKLSLEWNGCVHHIYTYTYIGYGNNLLDARVGGNWAEGQYNDLTRIRLFTEFRVHAHQKCLTCRARK